MIHLCKAKILIEDYNQKTTFLGKLLIEDHINNFSSAKYRDFLKRIYLIEIICKI